MPNTSPPAITQSCCGLASASPSDSGVTFTSGCIIGGSRSVLAWRAMSVSLMPGFAASSSLRTTFAAFAAWYSKNAISSASRSRMRTPFGSPVISRV
ncbi:MAG: hypothetical protein BWY81_00678 [Firmicutes bacterium ADurb.Bin467]|nr:MAG: hypothetical protein BWY81_00678 [Firmicutes bacterium ADurb.Bin467]